MRCIILAILCLTVASATYTNRHRFNRLLRDLERPQQQRGYRSQFQTQCDEIDGYCQDELNQYDEDEDDDYYQQQQQCGRRQNCNLNFDDDEIDQESNEQFDETEYYQGRSQYQQPHYQRYQHQGRKNQQRHQCQPHFGLLRELEQANTHLASKLYKQAKHENDDKNTVISPAAVQLALAAISRGARGNTRRQLRRVTGVTLNEQQNQQAHAALHQVLRGQSTSHRQTGSRTHHAQIRTTTTIVVNQRNHAQRRFIQAVQTCVNAQVKTCNFQHQPQQCRQQINRHVAQKTNNKLQHVVPQDAVSTNTKLVVVSTAQLKAQWSNQFRRQQQTKSGRFYPLGSSQPKHIQVLRSQGQFNYYEDEQLQVVGVPTQQQELTLYVIVPKDKDGLGQIEKQQVQNGQQLKQLLEQTEQQREQIQVELPKFKITHKIDAKHTLRREGVQDVFDADEADLSGITGQQQQQQQHHQQRRYTGTDEDQYETQQPTGTGNQVHVNKLIHQATIKVDEQGISAAQTRRTSQYYETQSSDETRYGNQYENEYEIEDDEDDDENDEHLQQYRRQQYERDELFNEIFGQQRRRHGQQGQYRRHHNRNNGRYEYETERTVKVNRAFAFAIKHNPSNQIVMVGRVVDATQRPTTQHQQQGYTGQQTLNGVDQE